jgi:hypothetical protein
MDIFAAAAQTQLSPVQLNSLPGSSGPSLASASELQLILGIVFGIIGALALLVIVISGFRYVTSAGDPQKTAGAKNGIIYALVGLAVALAAETIIRYVVGNS